MLPRPRYTVIALDIPRASRWDVVRWILAGIAIGIGLMMLAR